jgi:UDP:flavonoid glycosyltransferase YjiC (YdhE family)
MRVLLCPLSNPGYLYSALAIGRQLRAEGHLVLVLCGPSAMGTVALAGLLPVNVEAYGPSSILRVGSWHYNTEATAQYTAVRDVARDSGADVLLTSVLCHGALLAAERLDLPAVVLGLSTWLWPFRRGGANAADDAYRDWLVHDMRRYYDDVRAQAGLAARRDRFPEQPFLGSRFLLRGHPDLEPPGVELPDEVAYVGPCAWEPPAEPDEVAQIAQQTRRVGKPVVYVHLGRDFGGISLWPRLNAAFTNGPLQAIVERGRSVKVDPAPEADLLVVRKPWLEPLVSQASLVLTNATSAPVLAALRHGIPLVVAPNGSEQPLLAASCIRAGVAVRLPDHPDHAADALSAARADSGPAERAGRVGSKLREMGGAPLAASIVLAHGTLPPSPGAMGDADDRRPDPAPVHG